MNELDNPFDQFKYRLVHKVRLDKSYDLQDSEEWLNNVVSKMSVDMIISTTVTPILTRMPIVKPNEDIIYVSKVDYFERVPLTDDEKDDMSDRKQKEPPIQCPECDSKDILVDSESDPDCIMWICKNCKEVIHSE